MAVLRHRVVRVTTYRENVPVDATKFTVSRSQETATVAELRVQFKIHRSLTKHPNTCDVTITNLAEKSRSEFTKKPLLVKIDAGYDDELRFMYSGDLRFGMSEQKGPSWETLLQLGDGDCMHRWARVNRSYAAGTSIRRVLNDAAASMGLSLPKNLSTDTRLDRAFPVGTTSHGPTRDEMTRLLAPFGYHYSIQNGVLRALRDEDVNPAVAIPIDEDHGMIGSPAFGTPPRSGKPPHVTVRMLLYPEINPGDLIKLKSRDKNGFFRVETVRHDGDTHGTGQDSWTTTLEIKPR